MADLILKNLSIVDGTGAPAFYGDIAVQGDTICAVGTGLKGGREINCDGLTATPGLIDIHNHSDSSLDKAPEALNYIHQGVTTMLLGNCGISFSSAFGERESDARGDAGAFGRHMDAMDALPKANNVCQLVGHGALRAQTVGMEDVKLTEADHAEMARLLRAAMESGAFGMSTGLIYDPGIFSTPDEISRLCRIVGEYGGLYATHMRNESDLMVDAFLEAVAAVRGTGARLEISHLKGSGRQNFGLTRTLLDLMTYYRRFGMEITTDAYPENYCHTGLASCLPPWARAEGHKGFVRMMASEQLRKKLCWELDHPALTWENILRDCTPEDTILSECRAVAQAQGLTLRQAADQMGRDPWDAAIELCVRDWNIAIVSGGVSEEENMRIFTHPLAMVCSDGQALPEGVDYKPHPRNYRAFVKVLYDFVEKRRLFTFEEAIRKMTSMPAAKIGLQDRGILRVGMKADIALFDRYTLGSASTYEDPCHYARGVEYVLVNGQIIIENGKYTSAHPGRLLRRGKEDGR